ncbi:MAG: hypothetical protein JW861_04840 [Bacteroidales bacterium]|nr:hypothetical protein [Bacteroidales bacterium]
MKTIKTDEEWLKKLLPEGFPYPSSTIISGPGGTGKPLVELALVARWLKSGGSLIGVPLQYPNMEFVKTALKKLYNIDLQEYHRQTAMIQLDLTISEYDDANGNVLKANLLKPEIWNKVIEKADSMIEKGDMGTMIFGSALNLLLFSPTYKDEVIKNIEYIIKNDKSKTYLFSVSTSAFADKIELWEKAADNLMFTRMEKPMRLFCSVSRMLEVGFSKEEIDVPISPEALMEIKKVAEMTRKRIIPEMMKI